MNTRTAPARRAHRAWLLLPCLLLGACASTQPVIYNAGTPSATQHQRMQRDVADCRDRAKAAVGTNARSAAGSARDAGKVGVVAFTAAAVAGATAASRDVWQRARAGAAGGASGVLAKTLLEWNEPDDVHQEYVERCLSSRGHDVLGWR
jgi:outer membrane lipoprotein SlyB